jgi:NAD(P)H-dependent flavin oxidoreductase YrpB (nitropropane dioxygenase family)
VHTPLCDRLGIEFPVFAFSHCRDVVAAATNAGAIGVLGASVLGPRQLEIDLDWIDEQTSGRPYGVDMLVPAEYVGKEEGDVSSSDLVATIPQEYRDFVESILARYSVPPMPAGSNVRPEDFDHAWSITTGKEMVDISLRHSQCRLLVNALGPAPDFMVEQTHAEGRLVAGMTGHPKHAVRQKESGVDFVVAQGYEAGGHTGDISTMVLVPAVVDAVDPLPVVAAGGIVDGRQMAAALTLGAQGVWCGSVWLTTPEAEEHPVIKQRMLASGVGDTIRTRGNTGKPLRQMKNEWTDTWGDPESLPPLPLPLQRLLVGEPQARVLAALDSNPNAADIAGWIATVGQGVGLMNTTKTTKQVVFDFVEGYLDALTRVNGFDAS